MPLAVVAIPIGHPDDLTLRARETLMAAAIVIGEERPEVERFLKRMGRYPFPQIELLNEHSTLDEVTTLAELCRLQNVALISDCGTPAFCDPGVELTAACRARGIAVSPVPGASSLMALLSVVGQRFVQFHFAGFPPREEVSRREWIQTLMRAAHASVVMDTPYRLEKLVGELAAVEPDRVALIGLDLTLPTERIEEAKLNQLATRLAGLRAEFIMCVYPSTRTGATQSVPPPQGRGQAPRGRSLPRSAHQQPANHPTNRPANRSPKAAKGGVQSTQSAAGGSHRDGGNAHDRRVRRK